ncbi:fucose permease [Algoriphagus ratkowskyi]|uniref:Fucose permease n=1 Tax=Algoriphagus ratkowskyi TaxID=57028 RepID=A0A2W7R1H7_9BACT|nr:MFS transporter [Algoriphagus ratkowskyi]PZX54693.1 fucose permease [Algoriphagus ratkowskyi]TXD77004.1 sugar MFS transporter [Algoriphagus ratkowskyi]
MKISKSITKKQNGLLYLIILIFFVISLMSNILGPIIPGIIDSFSLSYMLAGFLPFSFFVAYGLMSLPAGLFVERWKEKNTLLLAFSLAALGALMFGFNPRFGSSLVSLFIIGMGMAILQVVINPLLRVAGGKEHFAFNSVLGQLAFGTASFLSPMLYTYLDRNLYSSTAPSWIKMLENWVPADMKWVSVYFVFAVVACLMLLLIGFSRFPKVDLKDDEKVDIGKDLLSLLRKKMVWIYFFGIFSYVGLEQGIANWVSQFLQEYHGVDPATGGAQVISYFWGLLTLGCLLGLLLLKFLDSKLVLIVFAAGAVVSLLTGLLAEGSLVLYAFSFSGFCLSVMWSILISLALNSLDFSHGTFTGILCSGIVGGAVVPLIIGALADIVTLQTAMFFLFVPLCYIIYIGFWAKPLVSNARVKSVKELFN